MPVLSIGDLACIAVCCIVAICESMPRGIEKVENGRIEIVSTMRFAVILTNKSLCRTCWTPLASTPNCKVCAETVDWQRGSCRRIEKITHLHKNYSYSSSISNRKAIKVRNESYIELNNREYMFPNNKNELCTHVTGWDYDLKHDKIIMPENGLQFYNGISNGDLFNIFYEKDYDSLPVKDKVVIDIGANIGDSSIYFAMSGAKKVIALEPFPKNFEVAQKNIALNGFTDKIELLNAGCCGVQNKDMVLDASAKGVCCQTMESSLGNNIHFYTLREIVDRYNIESPAVLKLDCEGCEYDIILSNCRATLDKFSHIQIEYHYGLKYLNKHLINASFSVAHTNPRYENGMEIGWIYATKS
jgi:FkbM family methyltransferase